MDMRPVGLALVLAMGTGGAAAGHAEIIVQRVAMEIANPLGQIAEREAHVQHLIVKREITDRRQIEPRLLVPVALAQIGAQRFQFVQGRLALPVRLQCEFQLPPSTYARKTEVVDGGHGQLQNSVERRWYGLQTMK